MSRVRPALPLVLGLTCLAVVRGQTTSTDGPLATMPAMFSVSGDSGLTDRDKGSESYVKKAGVSGSAPDVLKGPGIPDFSAAALFRTCVGTAIPKEDLPQLDAVSLGLDVITVTPAGVVSVPRDHWAGFVFSPTRATRGSGVGNGKRLRDEAVRPDGAGGDLFGYIFRGAFCLPSDQIAVTHRIGDSREIRLPISPLPEIDSVDVYAAMYGRGFGPMFGLPPRPDYYFSVVGDAANLKRVPKEWWGSMPVSGATIFKLSWDGSKWSCPKAVLSPKMLGLEDCEDVDAFAFDGRCRVVFSTKRPAVAPCPDRPPLLFTYLCGPQAAAVAVELKYADDVKVVDDIGIGFGGTEDLDALCFIDPSWQISTQQRVRTEWSIVSPQPLLPGPLPFARLWGQSIPFQDLGRFVQHQHWMFGAPQGGAWVLSYYLRRAGTIIPFAFGRVPNSQFDGNPVGPVWSQLPRLSGTPIELVWIALGPNSQLHASEALRVIVP